HRVLDHCRALLIAEFGGSYYIDRDYDPSLPEIQADEEQLTQAIINIARNSVQALNESGNANPEISFNTRAIRKHDPETGLVTSAIRLRVEDNGPGIPADLKDRIFFPMVSGRPQGSGIGLSITQSIISRHHGWIEVNSVPGLTQVDVIIPFGGYE
ncbi:MAG: ATP-binding protein, partial [Gammaproteobacteria bacterium]